jgi:hypothetical protein
MIALQFAAEDGWPSRLIEFYGHGAFSHVDAVLPDGNLLGARLMGGVAIRKDGYAHFARTRRIDLDALATPAQAEAFYAFLTRQVGKPYDSWAIAGFVSGRDWRADDKWFCSELAAAALEAAGIIRRLLTPANKLTPPDLLLVLSALTDLEAA